MGMSRVIMMVGVLIAAMLSADAGRAAESDAHVTAHTRATLVTDRDAVGPDGTLGVALRLQLQPGWHTYWLNPGDAGDTPRLTVQASGGAHGESHEIKWPVPERLSEGGLMAYAYTGHVLLPQILSLHGKGPTTLKATADWLVCADVCVPESGEFTLALPASSTPVPEGAHAPLFHEAEAAMPQPSPFHATLSPQGVMRLEGAGLSSETIKEAWFLPFQGGVIRQTAEQALEVTPGRLSLTLHPDPSQKAPLWRSALSGIVVLVDQAGARSAVQVTALPQAMSLGSSHEASFTGMALVRVLVFAVLGGLILNLMPCVFPVLAMKALSLARMGGAGRREAMESAGFYAIGVVASFGVLGAVMIGLRSVGSAAGWGFQFQSPGFVVGVCWLLFMMALNLLGVFQLTAGRFAGQLDHMSRARGRWGDLLTGLLAVIVATPCTAPFMGVAIAGALSGPVSVGMALFLAMGVGLAAPYVLIATLPGLASRLPRPGGWMDVLKQFLAFPLLASCVWLLWVVSLQRGPSFVALTAGGAVLLALGGWLYGLAQKRRMREGGLLLTRLTYVGAMSCMLLSVSGLGVALFSESNTPHMARASKSEGAVEPFSEKRLATLRAEGKPVFVDMTASWCITCMVNERVALDASSVQKAFAQHHVVTLRGDWTNRDGAISAYLKKNGRDGVPFYIYYPPHKEGVILPQILTPNGVIQAVAGQRPSP